METRTLRGVTRDVDCGDGGLKCGEGANKHPLGSFRSAYETGHDVQHRSIEQALGGEHFSHSLGLLNHRLAKGVSVGGIGIDGSLG